MADPTHVMDVAEVSWSPMEDLPPTGHVSARGHVNTGGWTNPHLSKREYVEPPEDRYQEFDFLATPPEGIVPQVITEVSAVFMWPDYPDWVKGVRVYSATNDVEDPEQG